MKLLHTADIHLRKDAPERVGILGWLVEKAEHLSCDYLIIAGDLFDSNADAAILRPQVKQIFDRAACQIILIPGNHDSQAFGPGQGYGKQAIQLSAVPHTIIEREDIRVCGIPYQEVPFSELVKNIPRGIDVLITHGTLYDQSFIFTMLENEETAYMPIYPTHLEDTARYVALGHLHSRYIDKEYKNTRVVYPGSPSALDTKCTDPRMCAMVSLDKKSLKVEPLLIDIAPYWRSEEIFVFPAIESEIPQRITELIEKTPANLMLNLTIRGFTSSTEGDFKKNIAKTTQPFSTRFPMLKIDFKINSWDTIIQNPLVLRFVAKTKALDEELRAKVHEIAFPIFCEFLK